MYWVDLLRGGGGLDVARLAVLAPSVAARHTPAGRGRRALSRGALHSRNHPPRGAGPPRFHARVERARRRAAAVPSFLYEGVHTDHHRHSCYGTEADPEYLPFGRRSPALIVGSTLASLLAPLALACASGCSRRCAGRSRRSAGCAERCSALVINPRYVRRAPMNVAGRVQEAAAFAVFWRRLASGGPAGFPPRRCCAGRRQRRRVGDQRGPHAGGAPLRPGVG